MCLLFANVSIAQNRKLDSTLEFTQIKLPEFYKEIGVVFTKQH